MPTTVQYYFTPVSPWAYLGHARFVTMLQQSGATVELRPADYGAVFAASGGLPLKQRAPARQAYRLVELKRFSEYLGVPLHPEPKHFPASGEMASKLILVAAQHHDPMAALDLTGRFGRAVWAEQRNIADAAVQQAILEEAGLPASLMQAAAEPAVADAFAECTRQAIATGAFGAPSYVIDGEVYWGQDRLDFVARRLQR